MSLKQQFATEATETRVWRLSSHPPRFNLNLYEEDDDNNSQPPLLDEDTSQSTTTSSDEMEAMFEKPLTPSDVGKLNRLVIPKQHAEKYFPLGGGDSAESKGLLLSFEDESGKCWRFRYSYWNSSQSYVLTKGWSRYVKEKRLDPGDVVLFHRHRLHAHRFFITWRRRHSAPPAHVSTSAALVYPVHPYPTHHQPSPYQSHPLHAAGDGGSQQGEMQRTPGGNSSSSSSSSKVLRLFGVNMECQPDNDSQTECSYNYNLNMSSPQGAPTQHLYLHPPCSSSDNPHHHMLSQHPY